MLSLVLLPPAQSGTCPPAGCTVTREDMSFGASYGAVEWSMAGGYAVHGWSYYLRAFNLVRDKPVVEIGWGQWSKPSQPKTEVCSLHPHGFTCENGITSDALKNCGSTEWSVLENCKYWKCGTEIVDGVERLKSFVPGSLEGGMGYWMYSLETPNVKWMAPAATNANYEVFGGTFLADRKQDCTALGGAVRVSNKLLVPNDYFEFEGGATADGFLGYMLSRTPLGKRSPTDEANTWTVVVDAANYKGPVVFTSSWFWDMRVNWHPKSTSWSDPSALIGYIAEGFEGSIGAFATTDSDGNKWYRTNEWAFPRDKTDDKKSTLYSGHSKYECDWAADALNPILETDYADLSAAQKLPGYVASQASAVRKPPPTCNDPLNAGEFKDWGTPAERIKSLGVLTKVGDDTQKFGLDDQVGFGVGVASDMAASNAAGCEMSLTLDDKKMSCDSKFCTAKKYLKAEAGAAIATTCKADATKTPPVPEFGNIDTYPGCQQQTTFKKKNAQGAVASTKDNSNKATAGLAPVTAPPADVKYALDAAAWPTITGKNGGVNDGMLLGVDKTGVNAQKDDAKSKCFLDSPTDRKLYCVRTQGETWISYRWYAFVDQPELTNVFAALPAGERQAAKCYMQQRIARLHEWQEKSRARWFTPPQGDAKLPQDLVSFDPALLLTPPAGLEYGYVPIALSQRLRIKPTGCDVVVGAIKDEPNPLPANYYAGFQPYDGASQDLDVCVANPESPVDPSTGNNLPFDYPGKIFPYSPAAPDLDRRAGRTSTQAGRTSYAVPTRVNLPSRSRYEGEKLCGVSCDPPVFCSVYDGNQAKCDSSYVERGPGGVPSGLCSRCYYEAATNLCKITQDAPGQTCDKEEYAASQCSGPSAPGPFPAAAKKVTVVDGAPQCSAPPPSSAPGPSAPSDPSPSGPSTAGGAACEFPKTCASGSFDNCEQDGCETCASLTGIMVAATGGNCASCECPEDFSSTVIAKCKAACHRCSAPLKDCFDVQASACQAYPSDGGRRLLFGTMPVGDRMTYNSGTTVAHCCCA